MMPLSVKLEAIGAWFISPVGLAISTWLSNILSLLAIIIGVAVALHEHRRALDDRTRELAREAEAIERQEAERARVRKLLIGSVTNLIDKALSIMTQNLPTEGEMYVRWFPDAGKARDLKAVGSSLSTLQQAASNDVYLVLDINHAVSIIDSTVAPPNWNGSPQVSAVLHMLKVQSQQLAEVRQRISD